MRSPSAGIPFGFLVCCLLGRYAYGQRPTQAPYFYFENQNVLRNSYFKPNNREKVGDTSSLSKITNKLRTALIFDKNIPMLQNGPGGI